MAWLMHTVCIAQTAWCGWTRINMTTPLATPFNASLTASSSNFSMQVVPPHRPTTGRGFRFSVVFLIHTLCIKKVPTFELSVTLSNLNRFSKYLHSWKAYEICYKPIWHYLPHLRHVATLPWEITNSNFLQIFSRYGRKSKQIEFLIAFNFASSSLYWLQIKFFNLFLFYLFTFVINLWHRKFVTSDVTAVFVNNQHGKIW